METYNVRVEFVEPLLGTCPSDPAIYTSFVAEKNEENLDEEVGTLPSDPDMFREKTTVFHRMPDGGPAVYDYTWKGYFKESCSMLRRVPKTESSKIKAFKKEIDGLLFVAPRLIPIILPAGGQVAYLERPIRIMTPQGERVALVKSEMVPAGSIERFQISVIGGAITRTVLDEWMAYGLLHGTGQWRNGGYGRFTCVMELAC